MLAVLAAGLPGFTVFQLCVRGLQAMQRAREVFALYVVENALTIALCSALGRHSLAGLTASVSLGYSATAIAALAVLAHHRVNITTGVGASTSGAACGPRSWRRAMAVAYAAALLARGALVARFAGAALAGLVAYGLVVVLLRRRVRAPTRQKCKAWSV